MIHADYNIGFFILTRMNHKNNPENILLFLDADHMKYIKIPIYRLFNIKFILDFFLKQLEFYKKDLPLKKKQQTNKKLFPHCPFENKVT